MKARKTSIYLGLLLVFGIINLIMAHGQEQNTKKRGDGSLRENSRRLTAKEKKKFDNAFKDFYEYQKREAALKKIKAMGQPSINELHKKIKAKKTGIIERGIGINVLKKLKHSGSTKILFEIAKDKTDNPYIRGKAVGAIYYLGRKNDLETFERLKKFVATESNKTVRRSAVSAIGRVGQKHAINYLKGILKSSETDQVKYGAITGLGAIEGEEAIEVLIDGLENDNKFTIEYARVVGSGRKSRKAVKPLLKKLEELKVKKGNFAGTSRLVIFEALGDIGDKSAIPEIRKYLDSEDSLIAFYASLSLCKLGDKIGPVKTIKRLTKEKENTYVKRIKKACGLLIR